jgi:hypothetical protein
MERKIKIFFCYAREDEVLQRGLEKQLRALQRQGLIEVWHDRNISAGTEWRKAIDKQLNTAQIILLLVSPDFMVSDFCSSVEMKQAIERHKCGETCVIPVILRPVYWHNSPFSIFQVLPANAKPIVDAGWHSLDEAFFAVSEGIRRVVERIAANPSNPLSTASLHPLGKGRGGNLNGEATYEKRQTVEILLGLRSVRRTIPIHVDLKKRVRHVLTRIVQGLELPETLDSNRVSYVLLFEGHPLELNESLESVGIEEGSILQLGAYTYPIA